MSTEFERICPKCGSILKHYDSVYRVVKSKYGEKRKVRVSRLKCPTCKTIDRQLPDYILPYKQYEVDIILGVLEGIITCETLGYEDYLCELTMNRWRKSRQLQSLL